MLKHKNLPWKKNRLASEDIADFLQEHFESISRRDEIIVTGVCPECEGQIRIVHPKVFVVSSGDEVLLGQAGGTEVNWEVIVVCNCGREHLGSHDDELGCGMELKVMVTDVVE